MKAKRLYPASSDDARIMKTCCCCLDVRLGTVVLGFLHLRSCQTECEASSKKCLAVLYVVSAFTFDEHEASRVVFVSFDDRQKVGTSVDQGDHGFAWELARGSPAVMIHIAGVVLLTQMLLHPELYEEHYYETYGTTPGSADNSVALAITFCSFIITLLLIYGCITRQPSYLLPFFCLQVFDFCVNLLGAISAISYIPELKMMLRNKANDMQLYVDKVDNMDLRSLMMTVIIVSMIILFIKAYFIACVWSCYKMLVNHRLEHTTHIFYRPDAHDFEAQNLLPNYEDAVKDHPAESPPPYTNQ